MTKPVPDSAYWRAMASGHLNRHGHALDAVLVSEDGFLWVGTKLCCGETVPESVNSWIDLVPMMKVSTK